MTEPIATASSFRAKLRNSLPNEHFADDDGGQADHDGAAAHVDVRKALILDSAAHRTSATRPLEIISPSTLLRVGVDALRPGHVQVCAGGADGAAQLRTEEPVQNGHDRHHERAPQ